MLLQHAHASRPVCLRHVCMECVALYRRCCVAFHRAKLTLPPRPARKRGWGGGGGVPSCHGMPVVVMLAGLSMNATCSRPLGLGVTTMRSEMPTPCRPRHACPHRRSKRAPRRPATAHITAQRSCRAQAAAITPRSHAPGSCCCCRWRRRHQLAVVASQPGGNMMLVLR